MPRKRWGFITIWAPGNLQLHAVLGQSITKIFLCCNYVKFNKALASIGTRNVLESTLWTGTPSSLNDVP